MRDENFLAESLEASGHTGQEIGSNQSDISGSEIEISALLNTSHQNPPLSSPNVRKQHKASDLGQVFQGSGREAMDTVTQNDINQIILSQLNTLGERLSNIEKRKQQIALEN